MGSHVRVSVYSNYQYVLYKMQKRIISKTSDSEAHCRGVGITRCNEKQLVRFKKRRILLISMGDDELFHFRSVHVMKIVPLFEVYPTPPIVLLPTKHNTTEGGNSG